MIFEILSSFTKVAEPFDGILLDAFGVFWGGDAYGPLPGSKELMKSLVTCGKVLGILSNSTQPSSKEMKKIHRHGIIQGEHYHFFVTSGDIARELFLQKKVPFETPKNRYWLLGGSHPHKPTHEAAFQGSGYTESKEIEDADFIYISVPHRGGEDQIDPDLFREEVEKIREKDLPMVCPNPDLFAHEGMPPRAVVRQGTIAKIYEEGGGEVFYIGKPDKVIYSAALHEFRKYNIDNPKKILMVGDTPETDIRGARRSGIPSALVTKTGMMGDRVSSYGLEKSIEQLQESDRPDYFIERFAGDISSSS